jgi:Fe-S-cluster-containing dehydrogenase component
MNRRDFLKSAVAGVGTVALPSTSQARDPKQMPDKAVGMLYDSTLCIGCKACVAACKSANNMPPANDAPDLKKWNNANAWDTPLDISGYTLNVIKVYKEHDNAANKDQDYAFMKRHCLHCVDPSCVSVCPVSAMLKDATTGVVTYNPDACIGCRYCVLGCPFSVPQFQYDTPFPRIQKCQFCEHLQKEGKLPACVDVCPTGASLFGDAKQLLEEAKRRLAKKSGETYVFPRGKLGSEEHPPHEAQVPQYQQHVYGEKEAGGTQVIYLSGVPFQKLGLPTNLPDYSYAVITESIQHTLYKGMIAPLALLGGLVYFAKRNADKNDEEDKS